MPFAEHRRGIACHTTLRTCASDSPWLRGIATVVILAPLLTACFELAQSRSASYSDSSGRSRGPSLRRGSVVLTIIGTITSSDSLAPLPSGFRCIPYTFSYAGVSSATGVRSPWFRSVLSAHPILYTPSPVTGFLWLVHPPATTGLRPRSRDSARPPYTMLSQHHAWLTLTRLMRFTYVTGCAVARTHGLGPRFSGVAPVLWSPSTRTPTQATSLFL